MMGGISRPQVDGNVNRHYRMYLLKPSLKIRQLLPIKCETPSKYQQIQHPINKGQGQYEGH